MSFSGFPSGTVSFYGEINNNNNREWFAEHKSDYNDLVLAPAAEFVGTFGDRLRSLFPGIQYDPRTSGSGSIMRIYRDTRFGRDKAPYKTWLGIVFWHGDRKKTDSPGYFFRLNHQGAHLHCGWHGLPKEVLHAFRSAVADDRTGPKLDRILSDLRESGYEIGEPHYKRVPKGYETDHPRAQLLKHADLGVTSPLIDPAELGNERLIDLCAEHAGKMSPAFRWLVDLERHVDG
ncbi:MAG: DUF2461 domain-containing protein [Spirochaetia bacterium]